MTSASSPPARRPGTKRFVLGLLLFFVLAPLALVAGLALAWQASHVSLDDHRLLAAGQATTRQAGDRVTLLLEQPAPTATAPPADTVPTAAACRVTGPQAQPVTLTAERPRTFTSHDLSWTTAYRFTASATGPYTVRCAAPRVIAMDAGDVPKIGLDVGWPFAVALGLPFAIAVAGMMLMIWAFVARRSGRWLETYADEQTWEPSAQQAWDDPDDEEPR